MKHYLLFLAVAVGVAVPAMATVTFSILDNEDGTVDIVVITDGFDLNENLDSAVAAIALDVSVDTGNIVAVTNYKTTGVSVDGDEGYGIYMGTISFTGETPAAIDVVGGPVAPPSDEDSPGQLPGPECTLEFGCLFDRSDLTYSGAPLAVTTLCTIEVSGAATLTLEEDTKRGGVVMIGGGRPSGTNLPYSGFLIPGCCGSPGWCCYDGQPDMEEWCSVGEPQSWCNKYQCRGDVDGLEELVGTLPFPPFNVYAAVGPLGDLQGFIDAYRKQVGDPAQDLATDFDHLQELIGTIPFPPFSVYARTGPADLVIFIEYYRDEVSTVPVCGTPPLTSP